MNRLNYMIATASLVAAGCGLLGTNHNNQPESETDPVVQQESTVEQELSQEQVRTEEYQNRINALANFALQATKNVIAQENSIDDSIDYLSDFTADLDSDIRALTKITRSKFAEDQNLVGRESNDQAMLESLSPYLSEADRQTINERVQNEETIRASIDDIRCESTPSPRPSGNIVDDVLGFFGRTSDSVRYVRVQFSVPEELRPKVEALMEQDYSMSDAFASVWCEGQENRLAEEMGENIHLAVEEMATYIRNVGTENHVSIDTDEFVSNSYEIVGEAVNNYLESGNIDDLNPIRTYLLDNATQILEEQVQSPHQDRINEIENLVSRIENLDSNTSYDYELDEIREGLNPYLLD